MKILLISANRLKAPYPVYPLGLDYVAGVLNASHDVKIIDLNCFSLKAHGKMLLNEFNPDLVGIALRNIDNTDTTDPKGFMAEYRELVDFLRKHSSAKIVLGGSGFTIFPDRILNVLGADFGIVGEGERLGLLVNALENGKDPARVEGVTVPFKACVVPRPIKTVCLNRNERKTDHLDYYLEHGAMLNLQTKRGCPFHCIYCTYPLIEGHRMRKVSPGDAAGRALSLQKKGAKYLFITDSSFNADNGHSIAVAKAFKKAGLSIPWGAFFTPVNIPDGYFKVLKDAGLTHVEFGTDALSDTVLSAYKKPFDVEQVFAAHDAARRQGLYVAHYFLLGGPGETPETLDETLSNIDKIKRTVLFLFCGMRIYPGTRLFERARKEGMLQESQELLEPFFYRSPSISNASIMEKVEKKADGRINWITGAGGEETEKIITRMYESGYSGPLWEYLIR